MSGGERRLFCPGCAGFIPVPPGAGPGDLIECANCAGVKFRLCTENGKEILKLVHLVTCPHCGEQLPVDDETPAGTIVEHDGRRLQLSREFGAFALEDV